jgi:prepilin-type N-terminal cleavage/methylation domain-containing protein
MWAHRPHLNRRSAFTFIEMSLVTALISILSLAVYTTFSSGARIWQKANTKTPETEIGIFSDKLSNDLRNWFVSSVIQPKGRRTELSFALFQEGGLVQEKDSALVDFGQVSYWFDTSRFCVYRQYRNYLHAADDVKKTQPQVVLTDVDSVLFSYYYFDVATQKGVWLDELDKAIPSAVKIQVSFKDKQRQKKLSKIITVYVADSGVSS